MMLTIIITLTLLHSISATLECPDNSPNWFVSADSCYLVSLEPLSWFAAQEVLLFYFFHNYNYSIGYFFSIAGRWEDFWLS